MSSRRSAGAFLLCVMLGGCFQSHTIPGTEAGTTDAGTADAGTTDAGTTDAGTTDAGPIDAGSADTGGLDAGSPQCGAPFETCTVTGETELRRVLVPWFVGARGFPTPAGELYVTSSGSRENRVVLVVRSGAETLASESLGSAVLVSSAAVGTHVALLMLSQAGEYELNIYDVATLSFTIRGAVFGVHQVATSADGFVALNNTTGRWIHVDLDGNPGAGGLTVLPATTSGLIFQGRGDGQLMVWEGAEGCLQGRWQSDDGTVLAERRLLCDTTPGCRLVPFYAGRTFEGRVPLILRQQCGETDFTWLAAIVGDPDDAVLASPFECTLWAPVAELDAAGLHLLDGRFDSSDGRIWAHARLLSPATFEEISSVRMGPPGRLPVAWLPTRDGPMLAFSSAAPETGRFLTVAHGCAP